MQHKYFRRMHDLLAGSESYVDAYATFLQSNTIPPALRMILIDFCNRGHMTQRNALTPRYV